MIILEKGTPPPPPPPPPRKGYARTCYKCKSKLIVEPCDFVGNGSSYQGSTDMYYFCPVCGDQNPIPTFRSGKPIEPETLIEP